LFTYTTLYYREAQETPSKVIQQGRASRLTAAAGVTIPKRQRVTFITQYLSGI